MLIGIDVAAIVIMESLGVIFFLVAFLFFVQLRRINDKQRAFLDAQKRGLISERGDGKCYSYEWVMPKPRKLLNATPLFAAAFFLLMVVFYFYIGPIMVVNVVCSLGYAAVIALIGISFLLWTDAFEAYSYANAIRKVSTEQLDKEDQSYMELAREALEKASLRFVSLGVVFAVLGPFIPKVFGGVVYALASYSRIFFEATETTMKISSLLGFIVAFIFPAFLLLLPELLGRVMFRIGKLVARKLFKRRVE